MKIAYLVSSPFSGSTLLSFMLNAHSQIGTVSEYDVMDEIRANNSFACSCGEAIRQCPFFSELTKRMNDDGLVYSVDDMDMMFEYHKTERLNRYISQKLPLLHSSFLEDCRDRLLLQLPCYKKRKEDVFKRNDRFMHHILEMQKASIFLDANKDPYRLKTLNERYPVKAIYLYKNGIAGAYSMLKVDRKRNRHCSARSASKRWFIEQITIGRCLQYLPSENIFKVSYSQLCNDPQRIVMQIHEFLGLKPEPIDNIAAAEHHIVGNKMRTGSVADIEERTDWQEKLTNHEKDEYRRMFDRYKNRLSKINPGIIDNLWY